MESKHKRLARRKNYVRGKIAKEGYRLAIDRSNRYIFAQVIDQNTGKTLIGATDKTLLSEEDSKDKTRLEKAKIFGNQFAKKALEAKVKKVVFDRSGYRYHGRVKAFVEGIREGGVEL